MTRSFSHTPYPVHQEILLALAKVNLESYHLSLQLLPPGRRPASILNQSSASETLVRRGST